MEPSFWIQRWLDASTAFHKPEFNPRLLAHWLELGVSPSARVLVPLCGKSVDLLWLAAQGHTVVGVELSPLAAEQFFAEARLTPEITVRDGLTWHSSASVSIACGDFFAFSDADFTACYDRAALIALPPPMRERYAAHLTARMQPGASVLLIALEYAPAEMTGPPFAVDEPEVRALYEGAFEVTVLGEHDVLDEEPRFRQRGLTAMREKVYRLTRRGA